jgi:heme-degrading monooxygenase HmoA
MRYLFMAFHYPKPEYRDDLLRAMNRFGTALEAQPGLLQLADFDDPANNRIVALSLWESAEHFHAGRAKAAAELSDDADFDLWETRPREVFALGEIAVS